MNIFDKFFLKLFLLSGPLLQRMNVNLDHLGAILLAKLTMDNRRPAAFQQMKVAKEKKELNQATLKTMFVSLIMGLFLVISFAIGNDLTTRLTIFFSMFIFMLAATLITDFTSVLIDTRDNLIILPKPVSDQTFVTARLMHIAIHINKLLLPLALPTLIAVIVKGGPVTILPFILMIFFATLLSIFLVNAVYLLILKISKPSKFQSIITYFQIAFAIVIYGGYQILPRMMAQAGIEHLDITAIRNICFYPPYWFADACVSLSSLSFPAHALYNLMLATVFPLLSIWIVVKYFAPAFNRNLSGISSTSEEVRIKPVQSNTAGNYRRSLIEKLASVLTSGSSEYMGFLFTWKMMGRSKDFKMKVYPGFGYMIVILAMMLIQSKKIELSDFSGMSDRGKSIFLIVMYMSSFIVISAINQLRYSEKSKAAWLFAITPVDIPGRLISGALKSVFLGFYLPVVLVFSVISSLLIGPAIIPNLILGFFNVLTVTTLMAYINLRELPFTVSSQNVSKGTTTTRNMVATFIPIILGVFHWLIFDYLWAVVILAILAIFAAWMVMDSVRNLSWAKIENFDVNR